MSVGDVMLGQSIGSRIVSNGAGVPWRGVAGYLDRADLVLANLECPISSRGTPWPKKFIFRAPPAGADSLGGGQNAAAAHAPKIVVRNGLRIGLLGYALYFAPRTKSQWVAGPGQPGIAAATPEIVSAEVAALKRQVNVVVVTFHGGRTNGTGPTRQVRALTRAAVAAGAALVIGHHPHVLQGYSRVGSSLVAYSLGNFVFDEFTGRQNDSAILNVTLTASGVQSFSWIPIVIERGFPRPAVGAEIDRIMARLRPIAP
jgi:poly-gamma-glutamate capsule biosynthesis protein CapA/YwtB (metallophosphatase superfamily)